MSSTMTFEMPARKLTWLITGCSSGFGLSLTRYVQAGGHTVIATSRNPSRTPELVKEVESKGGRWIKLDVTDLDTPKLIDELEKSGQHIDVLVNNAGASIHAPVETSTEAEIRTQMETLYFGPLRLIRSVLPYMRQRRFGVIVNMSSGASLGGQPTMGPYAGAKAALDGITRVLAKEIEPFNIRTLTLIIGGFNTSFANNITFGEIALSEDYETTICGQFIKILSGGTWVPDGDKDKAMKAIYEIVVGEGVGAGHESEKLILLGKEMVARANGVQNDLAHALEVFGDITTNVSQHD